MSELFIPSALGQVSQVHEVPATLSSTKRLIVLQDAHANYEGQKHLSQILDRLASAYGIHLILVEGGEGDVGLSYLRKRGSQAVREELAEEYLQSGVLSGEEYLDIVSDHPLTLWGVDDPSLYDEQFSVFVETERLREPARQALAQLREVVEQLKAQRPNEALRTFEANQAAFEAGELEFSAYLDTLLAESKRVGVAVQESPGLWRLVVTAHLEADIDQEQVAEEQQRILKRLRPRVSDQAWGRLRTLADRLKGGEADPATFYRELATLAEQTRIDLADAPALQLYIRYIQLKADLSPQDWLAELGEVQREVKARLAGSPAETALLSLSERLARCEQLIALEWTPTAYHAYRAQPDSIRLSAWLPDLQDQAARAGLTVDWPADPAALDRQLAQAARFYKLAVERDTEIARRTLAQMDAAAQDLAVLITGGFHTDHLIELLAEQGVSMAVITPWVDHDSDPARYAEVLKAKYRNRLPRERIEPAGLATVSAAPAQTSVR